MFKLLNVPYPFLNNSLRTAILKFSIVSVFIIVFLWLFDNENNDAFYRFIDYGIIIFVSQLVFLFWLPKLALRNHNLKSAKLWQYAVSLILFTLISYSLTFTYNNIYFSCPITFNRFVVYMKEEIPLSFPIIFLVVCLDYIFLLKEELSVVNTINTEFDTKESHTLLIEKDAPLIQKKEEEVLVDGEAGEYSGYIFLDEFKKQVLEINKAQVLYIKGADNYIEVYYFNGDIQVKKELIRNKLMAIEMDEGNDFLDRVHRSYLCNLNNVSHLSGNSKGYILHFKETEETIPVSRAKSEMVIDKLKMLLEMSS